MVGLVDARKQKKSCTIFWLMEGSIKLMRGDKKLIEVV